MPRYHRTEVVNFYELPEAQQIEHADNEDAQFVESPTYKGEYLPLNMFERSNGNFWDGIYGTSYFSGYFIKLSNCGEMAVVADRWQ